jgi:hypothetical protein
MYKIAIIMVAAITIAGAVAAFGPARHPKAALATTIDPTAMMRTAKDLPADPAYPAF